MANWTPHALCSICAAFVVQLAVATKELGNILLNRSSGQKLFWQRAARHRCCQQKTTPKLTVIKTFQHIWATMQIQGNLVFSALMGTPCKLMPYPHPNMAYLVLQTDINSKQASTNRQTTTYNINNNCPSYRIACYSLESIFIAGQILCVQSSLQHLRLPGPSKKCIDCVNPLCCRFDQTLTESSCFLLRFTRFVSLLCVFFLLIKHFCLTFTFPIS